MPPSHDDFRIEQRERPDGATLVSVFGEVDLATADQLEATLEGLAAQKRTAVLDLSRVDFMDSSGIGVLVRATHEAQRDGWTFLLSAELSESVSRLFTVSGMHEHLPVERAG